jgi:hypothetical protein
VDGLVLVLAHGESRLFQERLSEFAVFRFSLAQRG